MTRTTFLPSTNSLTCSSAIAAFSRSSFEMPLETNTGSRTGLIDSLREMRGELSPEETELRELTDSALTKLCAMTDEDFAQLELYPDFDQ